MRWINGENTVYVADDTDTVVDDNNSVSRNRIKIMSKYLWLAVEADKYELPIAVADSARELGEMMGSNKHNVETFVCKQSSGKFNGFKYIKVLNDG